MIALFLDIFRTHWKILVGLVIVSAAFFYLQRDIQQFERAVNRGALKQVQEYLSCERGSIADSVLIAERDLHATLRLLIHFEEKPSVEVRDFFISNGIRIYPESWIYDYMVADAPISKLCFLASLPGITSIELGG